MKYCFMFEYLSTVLFLNQNIYVGGYRYLQILLYRTLYYTYLQTYMYNPTKGSIIITSKVREVGAVIFSKITIFFQNFSNLLISKMNPTTSQEHNHIDVVIMYYM